MIHYQHIVAPYRRYLASLGREVDASARAAIADLCAGNTEPAAAALASLDAKHSSDPHLHAALGFVAYQRRDGPAAIGHLERALELAPDDAHHRALLAVCQLGMRCFDPAVANFLAALRIMPSMYVAHTLLWSALEGAGRLEGAVSALKRTLIEDSRSAPPEPTAAKVDIEATTLCIVDCANHALAERTLRLSMSGCRFEKVKWLTDRAVAIAGVETVLIPPVRSMEQFSRFMVKDLLTYIDTEFVLTIQWDGYVVNPAAWTPEFLLFDYIGARWDSRSHTQAHHNVGNGGFSLRSRSLLEALQDAAIDSWHPEDRAICREHRSYLEDRHGIVFAADDIADRFSFEHLEIAALPFGFHSLTNLTRFVSVPGWPCLDFYFGRP